MHWNQLSLAEWYKKKGTSVAMTSSLPPSLPLSLLLSLESQLAFVHIVSDTQPAEHVRDEPQLEGREGGREEDRGKEMRRVRARGRGPLTLRVSK